MPIIKAKHAPSYTPSPVTANAWGKIRSRLANAGYSNAWIRDQIGNSVGGRDKSAIVAALESAMKTDEARRQASARKRPAQATVRGKAK